MKYISNYAKDDSANDYNDSMDMRYARYNI